MIVLVPVAEGVKVTEHVAVAPVPDNVQEAALKLPAAPVEPHVTVPVGVVGETFVSVTVAVHVVAELTGSEDGEQATVVVVV